MAVPHIPFNSSVLYLNFLQLVTQADILTPDKHKANGDGGNTYDYKRNPHASGITSFIPT
jgi:hypothetical protein